MTVSTSFRGDLHKSRQAELRAGRYHLLPSLRLKQGTPAGYGEGFLPGCLPTGWRPGPSCAWSCCSRGAGSCTSCWNLCGSCQPVSPGCRGAHGWHIYPGLSTIPPGFVPPANLLRVLSAPSPITQVIKAAVWTAHGRISAFLVAQVGSDELRVGVLDTVRSPSSL